MILVSSKAIAAGLVGGLIGASLLLMGGSQPHLGEARRAAGVNGKPGQGHFDWARKLGRLTTEDEWAFWESECKAVYDTWKVNLIKK